MKQFKQLVSIFIRIPQNSEVLCDYSMKMLGQNQFEKAIDILTACYNLTDPQLYHEQIPEKRILVLNNLGCAFRKMGRLEKARVYLEEAYGLVQKFPYIKYGGITYMNICAVLSQAGIHDTALKYALFGLQECQSQLLQCLNDPQQRINTPQLIEKVKFTAISFHNVGIEEEYFKNFDKSREYYRESYTLFEDHGLPLSDPLYLKFKHSYQRCIQNGLNKNKKTSPDRVINKIQIINSDRPKSFSTHQNSGDGFYFNNNKLINKRKFKEDILRTQIMNKLNQSREFYDDQNFRVTVKRNNFIGSQGQLDKQQFNSSPSSPNDEASERSRTKISPDISINSFYNSNSSPQKAKQEGLQQEIKEMQLIGILDWSESDKSDEESQQNKNNRMEFIKQLQEEILDETFNENQDSTSPQKSQKMNITNISKQGIDNSTMIQSKQSIKSESNKQQTPKSNGYDSPLSITQKSNKNLDKSRVSKHSESNDKKSSIAESMNNILQKSILRQYGVDEDLAAIKIQSEWRKLNLSKKQKQKLAMKIKKKLIAQRQKQIEKSVLVIQKYYRKYQSKSNINFFKDTKKQKQWNICYKQVVKIKEEIDMENSNDRWEYYQNPNNHKSKIVKIQISYNNLMTLLKVKAVSHEKQKNMHKKSYECQIKLSQIQSSPRILKLLNSHQNNLNCHNSMKQLAYNLVNHIFICGDNLKLDFSFSEQNEGQIINQPKERNKILTKIKFVQAVITIQNIYRKKKNKEKIKLHKEKKTKMLKKWIFKIELTDTYMEVRLMQYKISKSFFFKSKDLSNKIKYPDLKVEQRHIDFWLSQKNDQMYDNLDIDQYDKTITLSNRLIYQLGIKNQNKESSINQIQIPNLNNINLKALINIQAKVKGKIARKMYLLQIERLLKQKEEHCDEENIQFICKSGYIFDEREPFIFKLYFQPIPTKDYVSLLTSSTKHNFSTILIECISLNKNTTYNKIEPVKQKQTDKITLLEVRRYGQQVLKNTNLKIVRNQLKIIAPNIEQLMQESMNIIQKRNGAPVNLMDPHLYSKLLFNKKTQIQKRTQYKSLVNTFKFNASQLKTLNATEIGDLCQRKIYYKYHNFKDERKVEILETKNINCHEQLQNKAHYDFPSNDFSKNILRFMEKSSFSIEDVHTRPKIDAIIIELVNQLNQILLLRIIKLKQNRKCIISQTSFTLDIYYDPIEKHIVVISQSNQELKQIGKLIINLNQIAISNEWNEDFFRNNIDDLLIYQLRQKNYIVYFQENKQAKRKQEALESSSKQQIVSQKNYVLDQKTQEKLASLQVFLFSLVIKQMTLDVFIHISEHKFIVNVSQKNLTKAKVTFDIMLNWFCCPQLKKIIDEKEQNDLQKLFYPLFCQITEILDLDYNKKLQQYSYNLEKVKQGMPKIIQTHYARKIQTKIKAVVQKKHYKFIKLISKQKEIHLNTDLTISSNLYFEKRWYLIRDQFKLRVVIQRYPKQLNRILKKSFYLDLLMLKKIFAEIANQKKKDAYIEPHYTLLLENNWTDIQGMYSKEYYQKTFSELINYLNEQIQISVIFSQMFVTIQDQSIKLTEEKNSKKDKKKRTGLDEKLRIVFKAIISLQIAFRKFKKHEWQKLKTERKKEKDAFLKSQGNRIKRTFKDIDGQMYIVNIYQRENMYTFDLILYSSIREHKKTNQAESVINLLKTQSFDPEYINLKLKQEQSIKKQKKQFRGLYEYDPNQLLNTGQKTVPEYLLERITIEGENVIFVESKFQTYLPGAYQNVKINDESLINMNESNGQQLIKQVKFQDLECPQEDQKQPNNNSSNLVNYLFHEKDGKQYIYNVIYTGVKPQSETKKESQKLATSQVYFQQDEEFKLLINGNQPNPKLEEIQENEEIENENIVKINVNLNELKKLYPTIDPNSQSLMKVLGEQFIDGIKLENNSNNILIDQSKLNPKCLEIEDNTVNMQSINNKISEMNIAKQDINQREKILQQTQKVNESKRILLKQTRFFSKYKYLVLIYLIERKVKKIQQTAFDTVFEEYEVLYQINCINLSSNNQTPIIWEVTPEEVFIISEGLKDNMERARFLMRHVQVFNNSIIFTVLQKSHLSKIKQNPNLVCYYEQGLIPIQNHFRNRRYRRNFQSYKEEMSLKHANIVHKCIPEELKSLTQYYLFVCIDHKDAKDRWELVVWDMYSFERYSKEIKQTDFQNYANEFGKQVTVESIAKFIDIDPSNHEVIINSGMNGYFKQFKEELKKKKLLKQNVQKKIEKENPYAL